MAEQAHPMSQYGHLFIYENRGMWRNVTAVAGTRNLPGAHLAATTEAPGPDGTIRYSNIPGSTRYLGTSLAADQKSP
jgi:phage tail sheath gpL-like